MFGILSDFFRNVVRWFDCYLIFFILFHSISCVLVWFHSIYPE